MEYSNVLEQLLLKFPDLKQELNDNDHLQGLPHCYFDIVLVPYIVNTCKSKEKDTLLRIGEFLEQMAHCSDINVRELLNVSILEPLVLDEENIMPILKKFLGKGVLKELDYWQKKYGKF